MSWLRERPRRALGVALLVLVALGGIALLVAPGRNSAGPQAGGQALAPAPAPVIGGTRPARPQPPVPAAELARARLAARRFLAGYLPYLYGRRPARAVKPVTASVAASLRRSHVRITPAQRRRHPRLAGLTLTGQTPASVIATARVADGGVAAYPLTFTLQRTAHGGWVVGDLGND